MHRRAGRVVAVLVAALLATGLGTGAAASASVGAEQPAEVHQASPSAGVYRAPTGADVIDAFRAPPQPWAAGNRGIDFDTAPGSPVVASAGGQVVFAGPVAGRLHVVLLHGDGLRTSYSFLDSLNVRRGQEVAQGTLVGTAGGPLHFGVRAGDEYLDPAEVLGGRTQVHLVADTDRRPASVATERSALVAFLQRSARQVAAVSRAAWAEARDRAEPTVAELRGALHYAWEATPVPRGYRLATGAYDLWRRQAHCTPAGSPEPRLTERHVLVLVAGLGSSSTEAAIDQVDTAALGYAPGDVFRFSYRGGTTAERAYTPADTTGDLAVSARRLRLLLDRLAVSHPGVPVDVIAHSQGGVVARSALTDEIDGLDRRLPAVRTLVTLASPHRGSDVATAAVMAGRSRTGELAEQLLADVLDNGIEAGSPAVRQLAETSTFIRELRDRPLPAGLRATSIAARGDLLVAAGRTQLPGAERATLTLPSLLTDHADLPGSSAARREIALGLAGHPPTCESLGDAVADLVVSETIGWAEDMAGAGLWGGGRRLDRRTGGRRGPPRAPKLPGPPRRTGSVPTASSRKGAP